MPKNSLATRAVTNFAVNATPSILAHVVGNALGGGELSKTAGSICDVIKTVGCKDRLVMAQEIKARALLDAKVCDQFLSVLYDSIQVYVQSDCKDYSMVVEAVIHDPSATLAQRVQYVKELKQQQHENRMELLKTVGKAVSGVVIATGLVGFGSKIGAEIPKLSETVDRIDKRHEETKRRRHEQEEKTKRKQEEAKRRRHKQEEKTKREQLRQQGKNERELFRQMGKLERAEIRHKAKNK